MHPTPTSPSTSPSAPASLEPLDFPAFRTAVSESFVPLKVTSDRPDPFSGSIRHAEADAVHFSIVSATEHAVERTPQLIAADPRRYYKLGLQLAGTGLLVQGGRETLLQPGSIAIYETDRPYSLAFDGDSRTLVVMFPSRLVDLPQQAVAELTATPLGTAGGMGGLVGAFLANLADRFDLVSGISGERIGRNAVDLVVTMLSNELAAGRVEVNPRQRLFAEITRFIDDRLRTGGLDPVSIAAAHYISPRHLHALFHENGTTVSTWVRRRRLEECRVRLADPAFAGRSISSIAADWGFADGAHFSRVFRAEFGRSPSDVRARH
ncbi:helix-turn-helix domain-containing protein [Agromyces larvae]|uniref:Helix-turn-helix domain-containing protein n=1 Tax=Agromyces larvae TaxID=2929802 RepID=A0ABY4BYZ7_9MICO|nr:helix-turn-helix domain-containing protein [Agromyces larvae]UOE44400.1 helix-turn-helix domain-containing protein [Agromyces larvae]